MEKKYLIIGGIGVAAVAAYVLLKRNSNKSAEDKTAENLISFVQGQQENVAARTNSQLSQEQAAYNEARQEYYKVVGSYPKSSWTLEQIEQGIEDYKELSSYIETYRRITPDDEEVDLSGKGVEYVKNLITQSENKKRISAWNERKKYIENIVEGFKTDIQDISRFSWLNKEYSVGVMQNMLNLAENEKIYANQYFAQSGGCTSYSTNLGKNGPFKAMTIAAAIPVGTEGWNCRKNKEIAKEVHDAYAAISGSVNEYGEIVK